MGGLILCATFFIVCHKQAKLLMRLIVILSWLARPAAIAVGGYLAAYLAAVVVGRYTWLPLGAAAFGFVIGMGLLSLQDWWHSAKQEWEKLLELEGR